jgi:hypothetical protein
MNQVFLVMKLLSPVTVKAKGALTTSA